MILEKFFAAFRAQLNKLANFFWEKDPIAQMQYEYDRSVEQLQEGRKGLELYRALVERVGRQVSTNRDHAAKLEAQIKAYLKAGERETAAKFALELEKAKKELAQNEEQLGMHEQAYENNLKKIQHAHKNLLAVREKIQKYDAELKMSGAEAEIAKLAEALDFNITTDFGQIEDVIQRKIDQNRAKVRVSADMSSRGVAEIAAEERVEQSMAEDALRRYEVELGLRAPETTPISDAAKNLGPPVEEKKTSTETN
ncbi:MAG: PspA/IM30 family protein [Gemmatimonadales bacterium]